MLSLKDQLDLNTAFSVSNTTTTRQYVFNVTRGMYAPDGVEKNMILINGQSPGPLIEANTGDVIQVVVHNMMSSEDTSIHWHGIDQKNSVWMDGVPGVTQCAIPPGGNLTYEFNVTGQRGTFWYHGHVSVQYTDGLYGPLIIHDPSEMVPSVDDEKIIMMGDLFHQEAEELLTEFLSTAPPWSPNMPGMEPPPDNIILNGQHESNCTSSVCTTGTLYSTHVRNSERLRLRLISHSTSVPYYFSIDSHTLEIVEIDGVEIEPILTTRVFINPGQRYSVIVVANQAPGRYTIRATAARKCFHLMHAGTSALANINFEGTGSLLYNGTASDAAAIGTPWDLKSNSNPGVAKEPWKSACADLPFDVPKPMRAAKAYDVGAKNYHYFDYRRQLYQGAARTMINGSLTSLSNETAALWEALRPNNVSTPYNTEVKSSKWSSGQGQQVMVSWDAAKGAQIVINSDDMMIHPWHLHGQTFQVVGWGKGFYGMKPTQWNLENPMRRDTIAVPGDSHLVLRIAADNPGVWAFHCHILWHAEGGMFTMIAQQIDELRSMLGSALDPTDGETYVQRFCPIAN
ncbi:multicopper oxidase-domain-containing protein [Xylariales sp. PMI_506]|nr:multicopper oxidase-domain-containing protein [Xylariales sp. PMI_506]